MKMSVGKILEILSVGAISSIFLGCLIININLAQFGFWDFNFLRFQYITSGILFIIFFGFTFFTLFFFKLVHFSIIEHNSISYLKKKRVVSLFIWFITLPITIIIHTLFFMLFIEGKNLLTLFGFSLLLSLLWMGMIGVLIKIILNLYRKIKEPVSKGLVLYDLILQWGYFLRVFFIPLLVISIIIVFASFIYPVIPRTWGGGKPVDISITFKNSGMINEASSGKLIYQNSNFLLINNQFGSFLLKEDNVDLIRYIEKDNVMIKSKNKLEDILDL